MYLKIKMYVKIVKMIMDGVLMVYFVQNVIKHAKNVKVKALMHV